MVSGAWREGCGVEVMGLGYGVCATCTGGLPYITLTVTLDSSYNDEIRTQ